MKKRIIALLTCLALIISVACIMPDSNAGIQTLNLSKQTKEIKVGESFQLSMNGVKASSIKWKSSKPGVATVSKKGVIKGIKAGTANITGKYKNLKFTVKVTVSGTNKTKSLKTFNYDDTVFELYSPKIEDAKNGTYHMYLGGNFSNKSSEPKSLFEYYTFEVYVNDTSKDYISVWGHNSVRNGASIESFYGYEDLKKGDQVEITLFRIGDYENKLYTKTITIK